MNHSDNVLSGLMTILDGDLDPSPINLGGSPNHAIVLFSGGLDSVVLLYWLKHLQYTVQHLMVFSLLAATIVV